MLLETLENGMQGASIEDLTTIEPGIAFSPWLERWSVLLPVIPSTPFGLTIGADRVLVSGVMGSESAHGSMERALESMLPEKSLVDWLTVAADD
jgi:hypothetical protein